MTLCNSLAKFSIHLLLVVSSHVAADKLHLGGSQYASKSKRYSGTLHTGQVNAIKWSNSMRLDGQASAITHLAEKTEEYAKGVAGEAGVKPGGDLLSPKISTFLSGHSENPAKR